MNNNEPGLYKPGKELLSVRSAAGFLGVSTRTVRSWIACHKLRALRVGSKVVRIDPSELDRFLTDMAQRPEEEAA